MKTQRRAETTKTTTVLHGVFGSIRVAWSENGIRSIAFVDEGQYEAEGSAEGAPPYLETLKRYLDGIPVSLAGLPVDVSGRPAFHQEVWHACQKVEYGQTATYAQLARMTGRPKAARAVGGAMKNNPIPLVIPCHRVVRSDGDIGGFSALEGVSLKDRLLAMERGDN